MSAHRRHFLHPIGGCISCGSILPPIGGLHLHGDYTDIRRQPDNHTGGRVFWHQAYSNTLPLYQHIWMRTGWKGMVDFLCLDWIWVNNGNRDSERVVLSVTARSCTTTSMSRWSLSLVSSMKKLVVFTKSSLKCMFFPSFPSVLYDSLFLQVIHDLVVDWPHSPSGAKCHHKILRDNIQGKKLDSVLCSSLWQCITKPVIHHLARWGDVNISGLIWWNPPRKCMFSPFFSCVLYDSLGHSWLSNIHWTCEAEDGYGTWCCMIRSCTVRF